MTIQSDSLNKRYLYKLISNLLGAVFAFLTQALTARALGPTGFGNYAFLTRFFGDFVSFFDSASSQAFYTKLSGRPNDTRLVAFYSLLVAAIACFLFLATGLVSLSGYAELVWPEQRYTHIWLSVVLALIIWIAQIVQSAVDAHGATVAGEIVRLLQRAVSLLLMLFLFCHLKNLEVTQYFIFQLAMMAVLVAGLWRVLWVRKVPAPVASDFSSAHMRELLKEFGQYCMPLVGISFVSLAVGIIDRWLVQNYSGAQEQGYLGFSVQLGTLCFLFSSAMAPLLTRELSKAHVAQDHQEMARLFMRHAPFLYSVTAFLSIFAAIECQSITLIAGGVAFYSALPAVALMLLYPIHQTYGQLCAAVFYATGHTRIYRNVGIAGMLLSLPFSFWLLLPTHLHGMELGAKGVAVKLVAHQFLYVNVLLIVCIRLLGLSWRKLMFHQFAVLGIMAVIGAFASMIANSLYTNTIFAFLTSGVIYCVLVILLAYYWPQLIGREREDVRRLSAWLESKLKLD